MPRKGYKRLNYEDRKAIEKMCKKGKPIIEIAKAVGVHRVTIYKELVRNGVEINERQQYNADAAQRMVFR